MAIEIPSTDLNRTVEILSSRIERLLSQQAPDNARRILIALAGVPGSGKSTISAALLAALPSYGLNGVVVIPMDGFHFSRAELAVMSDPILAFRKRGAPFTFDAASFLNLVTTLRATPVTDIDQPDIAIKAPNFDHTVQDPIVDDIQISSATKVVIIEGNYTLLDEAPWKQISEIVDERWFVDVPPEIARERLILRHLRAGVETTREAAAVRAEDNDIPNGELIRSKLIQPDLRILN